MTVDPNQEINSSGALISEESVLTKREYFAALAMQGLIAMQSENWCSKAGDVAVEAVEHADALIAALNGEGQANG